MKTALYILSELSDTDVEWMITHGRRERLAAGTVLIQEGNPIEALYILLDGQLAVSVQRTAVIYLTRRAERKASVRLRFRGTVLPRAGRLSGLSFA